MNQQGRIAFLEFFSYRTFWQVFGTALLTAVFVVGMIVFIATEKYEKLLYEQMQTEHNRIAERMAKEMGLFFEQSLNQLRLTGDIFDVLNLPPEKIRTTLNEVVLHAPHLEELQVVDSSGKEIATSEPRDPAEDFSESKTLELSLKGENWVSPVLFSENRVAYISISVPLYELGAPTGFLMAKVSLKKLWWWIDEINSIGDTRLSVVESENGLVVADQLKTRLGREHPFWRHGSGDKALRRADNDVRFISIYPVPNFPMKIITETTTGTFIGKMTDMKYHLLIMAVLLLILSGGMALYSASRVSIPMNRLINTMEEFGKSGKVRVNEDMPGEFRQIADAFNRMAGAIEEQKMEMSRQQSLVAIGNTLSGVSHEIRHGLTHILNLLHDAQDFDPTAYQKAKMEISDMNSKMKDLLEFSRTGQLNMQEISAKEILFRAKELVRYRKEAENCEIVIEDLPDSLTFVADESKLSVAMSNLIRNSIEAGGTAIKLFVQESDQVVELCVSDNGPGIPADMRKKVFEPFYTEKARGFGLGLSIVEVVAKAHGGKAYIASGDKEGVEFRISLPVISGG